MIFAIIRLEGAPFMTTFDNREVLNKYLNEGDVKIGDLTFLATKGDINYTFIRGIEEWPPNTAILIDGEALRVVSQTVKIEYKAIG